METIDFAKYYAGRGWDIFPCKPKDKVPMVKWQDEATSDMSRIEAWWTATPEANIGLATGPRSGFFALDVDAGHGGVETLKELTSKHGQLPETVISNTGGGGYHYLFSNATTVKNTASRVGKGIDTRGEGGYIVVPNSYHPSGKRYEWDKDHAPSKTELAPAPNWLLELLTRPQEAPGQAQQINGGAYSAGQRNSALTSLAGAMRRKGMSEEAIFLALNAENINKCVPQLSEMEVRNIAQSVMRYNPQDQPAVMPRDRIAAEWAFMKSLYEAPEYIRDFSDLRPEYFSQRPLGEMWADVLSGIGIGQAAANSEVLADIEGYTDWMLPRVDVYADAIKKYAVMDRASKLGWKLQRVAESGDISALDGVVIRINTEIELQNSHRVEPISDTAEELEQEIEIRANNPTEVWGIPYAWDYLSRKTGGKQIGELTLLAGEPGVGKSYFATQDMLETATTHKTPVFYWSGEMKRKQILLRMYQLMGVNGQNVRTGKMTDQDWNALITAKAIILNSPIYIDDGPMQLHELKALLQYQKDKNGIKQFILDYAFLIDAPGRDEIEKTANVSRVVKLACKDLDLAGILISSVSKTGMDTNKASKGNIRGSGQQIHDADNIFTLTTFSQITNDRVALRFQPSQYDKLVTLHINKGRELAPTLPGGVLHFSRNTGTPAFKEELQ